MILFKSVILKTETIALNVYALIVALSALYVCKCSGRVEWPPSGQVSSGKLIGVNNLQLSDRLWIEIMDIRRARWRRWP